jgi:DNA-binding NarL/FixJ family response regulator
MPTFKIAIADDYPVYRDGLQVTLSADENLELIYEADNGKELLDKMEGSLPDLVIMDYKMPVMDGMTATRQIKEKYPSVKVLVISMFHDEQFIRHLMDNGADGYLLKDAEPDEILSAIHKLLYSA